jgi:tRNA G18 (ribose-2'-O)-methylase SpoU
VPIIRVDDPDDTRLSDFRAVSDPALARTSGLFIAEGRLVVRRLLTESPYTPRAILVTPAAMKAVEDVLPTGPDVPVYVVPQAVMDGVTGFNIHRGCLASGERPATADWRALAARSRRAVVLERVGDADNVGAIFRCAAAFGVDVVLTGPDCADPLYRKAIRTSMGATLTMPFAAADPWPSTLTELTGQRWTVAALTPSSDALPLRDFVTIARSQRVALVLGHEGDGLTAAALTACNYRVRIPIHSSVDSLNVAMAATVALYELGQRGAATKDTKF